MADPSVEKALRAWQNYQEPTASPADGLLPVPRAYEIPTQKQADLPEARRDLRDAAQERFGLGNDPFLADQMAGEAERAVLPPTPPVDESFTSLLARALLPQTVTRDLRPLSAAEMAEAAAKRAPTVVRQALLPAPEALGFLEELTGSEFAPEFPEWFRDPSRNILTPEEQQGLRTENGALYLMRVLGSGAEALVTETAERLPLPDVAGAAGAATPGDAAAAFFSLAPAGRQVLGFDPGALQRVRREENPVEDWARGVLERVERGAGFQDDMALAFKTRGGEDWENTGWKVGLAVSLLTNWEGAIAKGPKVLARIERASRTLPELVPEGLTTGRSLLVDAIKGNEIEAGEWLGEPVAKEVVAKRLDPAHLPPKVKVFAEQIAQYEHDATWGDLLEAEGLDLPTPAVPDPAHAANVAAIAQAQAQAAQTLKGLVPSAGSNPAAAVANPATAAVTRAGQRVARQRLPAFEANQHVNDAEDFWRQTTELYRRLAARGELDPLGYHIIHSEGWRRFDDAADQSVDDAVYVLRAKNGDVIHGAVGTFAEMAELALKRQKHATDEIWYGSRRPVARWTTSGGDLHFGADYFFSSPVEERMLKLLRKNDPRALPKRLQQAVALGKPLPSLTRSAQQAIGHTLANAVTGAPTSAVAQVQTPGVVADVIRKAYRLAARDAVGSDVLEMLPSTALVAKGDRARILAQVDQRLPLTADEALQVIHGTRPLDPKEAALWKAIVPEMDTAKPSVADWQRLHERLTAEAAGVLNDARYRVQGMRGFADRLTGAFKDLHVRRGPGKLIAERWGGIGWFITEMSRAFAQDVLDRMPPQARTVWKQLRLTIEADADELAREIKAAAGRNPLDVITASLQRYKVPHPSDLERAESIVTAPAAQYAQEIGELRQAWRGTDRPTWLDHDDELIYSSGMRFWARDVRKAGADAARDWLLVNLELAKKGASATSSAAYLAIKAKPDEELLPLLTEFAQRGNTGGPILARLLGEHGADLPDQGEALIAFALHARKEGKINEALGRMVRNGMAVRASDPRLPALQAMLLDKHRAWNAAAKRWEYAYPEAQITWARSRLTDWGLEPGAGSSLVAPVGARQAVFVPEFLSDEAERLLRLGIISSKDLTPYQVVNRLFRLFKEATTHGILLPNPAHFTGQMLSIMPTLVTTQGLGGAMSAMGQLFYSRAPLCSALVKRLGGKGFPTFRPRALEAAMLRTADGRLIPIEELEEVARRLQLGETRTDFEVAHGLQGVLQQPPAGVASDLWGRLSGAVGDWQHQIRMFAGAFDLNARIAVFVDQVAKGVPLEQAALEARRAALDFRDLTPFESKYMRFIFTFYAFMRKNSDAYLNALLRDPARVTAQMRLARASLTSSGLSGLQLGGMTDADVSRLNIYSSDVVSEEGRPHPNYRLNRVASTPLGVGEWLGTMRMLMPIPSEGPDLIGLAQSLNPAVQALLLPLQGRRIERDIDRPWGNRIPPWMLDAPGGDLLADAVGAGWEPLGPTDDPLLADDDATLAAGVPAYWAAGSVSNPTATPEQRLRQRILWQEILVWLGRPLSTVELDLQAIGLAETPPTMTQGEAFFDAMLGFRHRPVPTEEETIRRAQMARQARLQDVTEELRPPQGIGPR